MPDYIIVGGGSAGCVLAARLSEEPGASVLLIEEGPADTAIAIHLPVMVYKTATGNLLQRFSQEETPSYRKPAPPTMVQARVLGGGSSVNGMLYVRGIPDDYDRWAASGADHWAYKDVLPYYLRGEDNSSLAGPPHASGGPLHVSNPEYVSPLTHVWLRAAQEAGIPPTADFNAGNQAGCGLYQVTVRNGRRASTARCYLTKAVRRRRNLQILTGRRVIRIMVENHRAVGVVYLDAGQEVCACVPSGR